MQQDDELDAQLRESILGEAIDTTTLDARIRDQVRRIQRGKWVAAASIAATVAIVVGGYMFLPNLGNAAMRADAARDHRTEVVEHSPRTWLTDVAALNVLMANQGFSGPAAAAIAPPGYRVERGKLCRLGGRVFLHLVYSDGSHQFSLYLRNRAAEDIAPAVDLGSEHVAQVGSVRFTALVVTDESRAAAINIARLASTRL